MQIQKHVDGIWMTSTYVYKGRKILIKSQKTKGIKCHVFYPNSEKVEFTLRYIFALPENILKKVKIKIDSNNSNPADPICGTCKGKREIPCPDGFAICRECWGA